MYQFICLAAPLLVALAALAADSQPQSQPAAQQARSFSRSVTRTYSGNYLLYLPPGYGEQGKKWPLMLFLHGAGERGDNLEQVKLHGPPKLIASGRQFPFIVVSPQCPREKWWDSDNLSALLDEICEKYNVDQDRIYLTGLSMGGFGTWDLVGKFPNRFAAIAPICGGGDPREAGRFKDVPTWAFHGGKDNLVPLQRSQEMVDAMKAAGGSPKFTIYPEAGHDSWTEAYNTQELYDWMLQQVLQVSVAVDAEPYVPGQPAKMKLTALRQRPVATTIVVGGAGQPVAASVTEDGTTVELPIPMDATGAIELAMTLDGRQPQKQWLVPAIFEAPKAESIVLDGKLNDWPAASRMADHCLVTENESFLPEIRLAWSDEGLYLAARMEAKELGEATPQMFWNAPNMEVFLDTAGLGGKGWPKTSHQFFILPVKEGETWKASIGEWQRSPAIKETIFNDARCRGAVDTADGFVTFEWFIPAEALGAAPKAGGAWRLGLAANASIPHRPVRQGFWPRTKDNGLLEGAQKLGEIHFAE